MLGKELVAKLKLCRYPAVNGSVFFQLKYCETFEYTCLNFYMENCLARKLSAGTPALFTSNVASL